MAKRYQACKCRVKQHGMVTWRGKWLVRGRKKSSIMVAADGKIAPGESRQRAWRAENAAKA